MYMIALTALVLAIFGLSTLGWRYYKLHKKYEQLRWEAMQANIDAFDAQRKLAIAEEKLADAELCIEMLVSEGQHLEPEHIIGKRRPSPKPQVVITLKNGDLSRQDADEFAEQWRAANPSILPLIPAAEPMIEPRVLEKI